MKKLFLLFLNLVFVSSVFADTTHGILGSQTSQTPVVQVDGFGSAPNTYGSDGVGSQPAEGRDQDQKEPDENGNDQDPDQEVPTPGNPGQEPQHPGDPRIPIQPEQRRKIPVKPDSLKLGGRALVGAIACESKCEKMLNAFGGIRLDAIVELLRKGDWASDLELSGGVDLGAQGDSNPRYLGKVFIGYRFGEGKELRAVVIAENETLLRGAFAGGSGEFKWGILELTGGLGAGTFTVVNDEIANRIDLKAAVRFDHWNTFFAETVLVDSRTQWFNRITVGDETKWREWNGVFGVSVEKVKAERNEEIKSSIYIFAGGRY